MSKMEPPEDTIYFQIKSSSHIWFQYELFPTHPNITNETDAKPIENESQPLSSQPESKINSEHVDTEKDK